MKTNPSTDSRKNHHNKQAYIKEKIENIIGSVGSHEVSHWKRKGIKVHLRLRILDRIKNFGADGFSSETEGEGGLCR